MIVNVDKCTTWTTTSLKKRKHTNTKNKFKSKSFASNLGKENEDDNDDMHLYPLYSNAKTVSLPASPVGSTDDLSSRVSSQSCVNLIIHQRIVRQEDIYQDPTYFYSGESLDEPLNSTANSIPNSTSNNINHSSSFMQIENSIENNQNKLPSTRSNLTSHLDKNNNNNNQKFLIESLNNPTQRNNNNNNDRVCVFHFCF